MRTNGHALKASQTSEGKTTWTCECGHDIGEVSVHSARAVWREHKAALDVAPPEQ